MPWAILTASYVLLASFVLVNVLIGVVISSLDEARELEREQDEERGTAPPALVGTADNAERELRDRIAAARRALGDLETSLQRIPSPHPREAEGTVPPPSGHT